MRHSRVKAMVLVAAGISLAFCPLRAGAAVKLPPALSSHMVLQRDLPVPVWGTAAPGEKVVVKFRGQEKATAADGQGKWRVQLDPLQAGGPETLTVTASNTLTLEDVLVGEVWVGSGQSNMAGGVAGYVKGGDKVLAKLAAAAPYPRLRLIRSGGNGWVPATEANVNGFSALLFPFGLRLQQELDVPVGLMLGAVGGTPSGYWLSADAYASDEACKEAVKKFAAGYDLEKLQKQYQRALADWEKLAEAAKNNGKKPPPRPSPPLRPGEVRGKVGFLYEAHIRPFIPYGIRGVLWDQGESGTAVTGVDQYTLMGALIRGSRKDWAQGEFPFLFIQKPSGGGCAWDPDDPVTDRADKFVPLPKAVPNDGQYREVHIRIMQYPHTGMAISSDLGPGIHPVNKSGYGSRASRVALGLVYGKKVEVYGPVYQSHKVEGGKVRLSFAHVGQGLAYRHGDRLQGFAVAGEDKQFHWAEAVIDGDSVVVSSPQVAQPVAVRYGWSQRHPWANLFNRDGLPALAFRTDSW